MKRVRISSIIASYKQNHSTRKTAQELGIGHMTVSRWVRRARKVSISRFGYLTSRNLARQSTTPHHIHSKLTPQQEQAIILIRKTKHIGAKKIIHRLPMGLSARTIHRFLKRNNYVSKQTNYRRPLFQNGKAMRPSNTKELGFLQMDTKHVTPELSGLSFTCYEYAAIDIEVQTSRYSPRYFR